MQRLNAVLVGNEDKIVGEEVWSDDVFDIREVTTQPVTLVLA